MAKTVTKILLLIISFSLLLFIDIKKGNAEDKRLRGYKNSLPIDLPVYKPNINNVQFELIPSLEYKEQSNLTTAKPQQKLNKVKPSSLNKDYQNKMVELLHANNKKGNPSSKKSSNNLAVTPTAKPNKKPSTNELDNIFSEINIQKKVSPPEIHEKYQHINISNKPQTTRKAIIVIDAGHGGKDPGAIGRQGTKEKNVTLSYAHYLKKELEKSNRYKVYLTRYKDQYIELKDRVRLARKYKADILISIHADSHANKDTRGFSVYTISQNRASRESQKMLSKADNEKISDITLAGESNDVKEAIIDFAQKETKSTSDDFAKILAKNLGKSVQPLPKTHREKSLAVLTGIDVTSVLLELGYLSNSYEEKLLNTKTHQSKIIKQIRAALDEYFNKNEFILL